MRFLTPHEHAVVAAAADRLIPPLDGHPGGGALGVADYVDKLPILYEEFVEAGRFLGKAGAVGFSSADDLMRKTPGFWDKYVRPKISSDFRGLFRFLARPLPDGMNEYLNQIEANMARIRKAVGAQSPAL